MLVFANPTYIIKAEADVLTLMWRMCVLFIISD